MYEHANRAVDFLWEFTGHHELVRIWGGDWNDCMNYAGQKGKGAGTVKRITVNGQPHKLNAPIAPIAGGRLDIEVLLG